MNKKAIAILGAIFLLIVGTLGFLVYSRYSSKNEENPPAAGNNSPADNNASTTDTSGGNTASTTPVQSQEKFIKLTTNEQVISPILFYNGNGVTYLNQNGGLIKADFETLADGRLQLTRSRNLDIQAKSGIGKILWPRTGDDFIAEIDGSTGSPSSSGKIFSYFNFSTGAYVDLAKQVKVLEWLPSGDKILFIWVDKDPASDDEKATLNIASPDTTNYQQISELWETDNAIYLSPDGLNIVFHRTKNDAAVNKIILTTPDGKVWKDLVQEGYNFGVLWSPDSQKFLFSKRERAGRNYQLWLYDLYTGEIKNLGLDGAPQKTVWGSDSRTIYFAAPQDPSEIIDPAGLMNADGAFTIDTFYKLDTSTLEKTEYKPENMSLDGRNLFLNASEDKLFFKNAQDGGLYYLDLAQ